MGQNNWAFIAQQCHKYQNVMSHDLFVRHMGLVKQKKIAKILIFFLSISLNMYLGAQTNRLIKTVLLSTHNMFWLRSKKNNFQLRALIWGPGRVFLGWTSTKQRIKCLAQGHNAVTPEGWPFHHQSSTLPQSHHAPKTHGIFVLIALSNNQASGACANALLCLY